MSKMVTIDPDYAAQRRLTSEVGLVLRGPYEHIIKLTEQLESCELMYDLLVGGNIENLIPVVYCHKLKR